MDANATHSDRVAFYLTGRRAEGVSEVGALRPALQARYRDLSSLRHAFPLVLAISGDAAAPSLTALVDAALASIAKGTDAERTRRQVLRVEQEVRELIMDVEDGVGATLRLAKRRAVPAPRSRSTGRSCAATRRCPSDCSSTSGSRSSNGSLRRFVKGSCV